MIQEQIFLLGDKIAMMLKTTTSFILLGFISFGSTLGNLVSVSQSQTGNVGEPLELTCLLNPTSGAIINSVKWFLGSDMTGIQRSEATCNLVGSAPSSYDLNRYSFTCSSSSNTFKLKILAAKSSDDGQCWSCIVTFSNFPETDKASACIKVNDYALLLLLLLLVLPLAIFIILICCGCLDCCKCCRSFDHYDRNKWCYVTWYCLKRGCCSFFCCRAESKRGTFSCCCKSEKECCGGCHFCQKICGFGWPDCCKSKKMRSCGCCIYFCCVEGLEDERLDENRSAITGPPAIHTGTQNKVKAEPTNEQLPSSLHQPLPPLGGKLEDKKKNRPPGNSDDRDQNIHGQSAKYDNTTGLATDATRPIKLPPLLATKQRNEL